MKRYVKLLPLTETLCRPAGYCHLSPKCQRHLQQHSGSQKLGDFKDKHYHDGNFWKCRMFVPVEYQDNSPPPPRHFKPWDQ